MLKPEEKKDLQKIALQLRYDLVEMIGIGAAGHLGGSCSLAETIALLYFHKMNFSADRLKDPNRDRLVLSKGHAALIQYAALCEARCFPREELKRVKTLGGLLQGHPDMSIPGLEAVTGSLGQGLSISLGIALALRLNKSPARVYTIMGDGEQSEGQLWEAAMAVANFKLDNLTAFIDYNQVQATGPTKDVFNIPELDKKWSAFGWNVINAKGHDVENILEAVEKAETLKGKPSVIILETIKGKGFSFAEGNPAYHNGTFTEETYKQALKELDAVKAGL
ncbi:transketolase [Treponema primitia ZAS-2]|uniref:Transketolase n=1 Tax=Treponema primitia (strain ATCC BAA-887 / DSM 12427 / ZAS-2) TaxID=545694 RepID=F5YRC4_TREPZ|nr:transketolase [Treponema primitia]AEF84419.1 transketolase [Treponema primitia ZAS-2]